MFIFHRVGGIHWMGLFILFLYVKSAWIRKKKTSAAGWRRILQSHRLLGRQWSIYKDQLIKIKVSSKVIYSKMRCASKQNPPVKFQNPQPWLNRNHSSQPAEFRVKTRSAKRSPAEFPLESGLDPFPPEHLGQSESDSWVRQRRECEA